MVRNADSLSNGRCFVPGNCAVKWILRLYFVWGKVGGIGIGRVKVSSRSFGIGGYGESTRGVGWVGGVGEELREAYAAEAILKKKKER
jgi:hypothetical protein